MCTQYKWLWEKGEWLLDKLLDKGRARRNDVVVNPIVDNLKMQTMAMPHLCWAQFKARSSFLDIRGLMASQQLVHAQNVLRDVAWGERWHQCMFITFLGEWPEEKECPSLNILEEALVTIHWFLKNWIEFWIVFNTGTVKPSFAILWLSVTPLFS